MLPDMRIPTPVMSNPWFPRLIEALIVLGLAWAVAGLITGPSTGHAVAPRAAGNATDHASDFDVEKIIRGALFGAAAPVAAPPKRAAPVAAPSRLNIRLLGTMLADAHSAAIVRLGRADVQKLVFVGDTLISGVKLVRVEASAIVVDNHGRMERILMAGPKLPGEAGVSDASPGRASVRRLSRALVEARLNNLPALLTRARVIPHQMNGKPDGFLIQEIVPGSLYDEAGLKNGDVIRKVNGKPVTRPEEALGLFQSLRSASGIDLEIARGGDVRTIHFDIR